MTLAMGHAYRTGLARARARGIVGTGAVAFARAYASKWETEDWRDELPARARCRALLPGVGRDEYHESALLPDGHRRERVGATG